MASGELKIEPIVATEEEQLELEKLSNMLNILRDVERTQLPKIVSPTGE